MALPLAGLTVLDLTLARAGPTAVRHLADWGASVIRIQPPEAGGEDLIGKRDGADYQNLHRNKRVICLDLKSAEGHDIFMKLAARADVIIENMRTPVKHRLKIAYEDVRAINPRIVYGSISGFGQTGPYVDRAGVDQILQGMGGLMSVTGAPGRGPMRVGVAISDMAAGTLLALAIVMALFEREKAGEGRWVHTSLLESILFMMDFQAARWLFDREVPEQVGNEHPTVAPTNAFPTADGYVNIAATSGAHWRRLCDVLGHPEWVSHPGWTNQLDRSKNRAAIHAAIAEETRKRPTAHWVEALEPYGLPCGPIYSVDQAFADRQVQHLNIAGAVEHPLKGAVHLLNSPLNFDGLAKRPLHPAAITGVDGPAILAELGYRTADIEALKAKGVI